VVEEKSRKLLKTFDEIVKGVAGTDCKLQERASTCVDEGWVVGE